MGKIFSRIFSDNETKSQMMIQLKEFGIGKSTVQGILVKSNKNKWLSIEGTRRREWQSLEDALCVVGLDRGLDLTGDIIKQKALFYAERMGFVDFKGSDGLEEKDSKLYANSDKEG